MTDSNSVWTVQSRSNFDNDGARPVPYLLLVSPVMDYYEGQNDLLQKRKRPMMYVEADTHAGWLFVQQ